MFPFLCLPQSYPANYSQTGNLQWRELLGEITNSCSSGRIWPKKYLLYNALWNNLDSLIQYLCNGALKALHAASATLGQNSEVLKNKQTKQTNQQTHNRKKEGAFSSHTLWCIGFLVLVNSRISYTGITPFYTDTAIFHWGICKSIKTNTY